MYILSVQNIFIFFIYLICIYCNHQYEKNGRATLTLTNLIPRISDFAMEIRVFIFYFGKKMVFIILYSFKKIKLLQLYVLMSK